MIFIDTGPFIARYVVRDQYHERAVAAWDRLTQSRQRAFTSNLVLIEAFTFVARQAGYVFAAQRARNLFLSSIVTILRSTQAEELEALEVFEKFADQRLGIVDSLSFVLMRKHRLKRAFTFDRHFRLAGFQVWP